MMTPPNSPGEVAGGQAHDGADDHRHHGRGDADEDGHAGTPEDAHPQLAAEVVGAQGVVEARWGVAGHVELLRDVEHRLGSDERGGDAMMTKKRRTTAPTIAGMSERNSAQFFFALFSRRSRTSFAPSTTGAAPRGSEPFDEESGAASAGVSALIRPS
jgi:hypothetical protein